MSPKEHVEALEACGWFEGFPEKEFAKKALLKEIEGNSDQHPLKLRPINHDAETWEIMDEGDYSDLLKELAKNSGGIFSPANISED